MLNPQINVKVTFVRLKKRYPQRRSDFLVMNKSETFQQLFSLTSPSLPRIQNQIPSCFNEVAFASASVQMTTP